MKVLVVEDDLEINELISEYLSLEEIDCLQATTGQAGIHQATEHHPDAIILGLMLPDIDGFEVAKTLTTCRETFDIPIVILSCMFQDEDRLKGFASGALAYMTKPFLPDDLLMALEKAFTWRSDLRTKPPIGTITLGNTDASVSLCEINLMTAHLFAHTNLPAATIAQIREAMELLNAWAAKTRLDYKITATDIVWKLSESEPGLLAEMFFKPASVPTPAWLHMLGKIGATSFEKDSKTRTVRFARTISDSTSVPVVEFDGTRYPTRLRDEAIAAKRK